MTSDNTFKCARCKGTFEKAWTDEEALAEMKELFGELSEAERVVICDDCDREGDGDRRRSGAMNWLMSLFDRVHGAWSLFVIIVGGATLIVTLLMALQSLGYTPTPIPEWCTDRWVAKCTEHRPLEQCRTDQRGLGCKP